MFFVIKLNKATNILQKTTKSWLFATNRKYTIVLERRKNYEK